MRTKEQQIQMDLVFDMVHYAGNRLYNETPRWNLIERIRWTAVLKFLQKAYSNFY